jgi:urease accessory protein
MLAGPALNRPEARVPDYVRAKGGVRLRFGVAGGVTQRLELAESGGYRARFPTCFDGRAEAVLINTGGGMAGGDHLTIDVALDAAARVTVTTQAAEKIYRSQAPDTRIETRVALGPGAHLDWLPQETILFSGARLARSFDVSMAADAKLIACESVYFGRTAMGEVLDAGSFRDSWRVRQGGRLIFADNVRLDGLINATLAAKAVADGARAAATVIVVDRAVTGQLEDARAALVESGCACGVSDLGGLLVARFLGPDAAVLRAALARFLMALSGAPLPRSWQN